MDVHTHVSAVLDFDSGPVVTLTTSFDVTGTRLPKIEIFGSEGTLAVPDPSTFGGPVWLLRRGEKEWLEMPLEFGYAENSRGIGVADMAAAIAAGREHRANERLAYHVLDLMHSIVDASETGRHIEMRSAMSRPEPLPQGLPAGKSRRRASSRREDPRISDEFFFEHESCAAPPRFVFHVVEYLANDVHSNAAGPDIFEISAAYALGIA